MSTNTDGTSKGYWGQGTSRPMRHAGDLADVSVPDSQRQPTVDEERGTRNDRVAQHKAAAMLNYQFHGNACDVCGAAGSKNMLCPTGLRLYLEMEAAGAV